MPRPVAADLPGVSGLPGAYRIGRHDPPEASSRVVSPSFRAIYETSFPEGERMAMADLGATLGDGTRWLYSAETQQDQALLSFAVVLPLTGSAGVCLLEYLATDARYRSQGIGGRLFRHVVASAAAGGRDLVFEVQLDDPTAPDASERRRRIGFYRTHGAAPIPAAGGYCMPDLTTPGLSGGWPMGLWWASGRATPPPESRDLRALVISIYADSYAITDAAHPVLRRVLASLPAE
jgi:GNAT superfamily N-acetyltransferase